MSEDLHNIDDLFSKGLEDNTEVPSNAVWENIDKSLDKKKVISISKKYSKLKWAAAVLLLFSIGMAMYTAYVSQQNKDLVEEKNQNKTSVQQTGKTDIKQGGSNETADADLPSAGNKLNDNSLTAKENDNALTNDSALTISKDSLLIVSKNETNDSRGKDFISDKSKLKINRQSKTKSTVFSPQADEWQTNPNEELATENKLRSVIPKNKNEKDDNIVQQLTTSSDDKTLANTSKEKEVVALENAGYVSNIPFTIANLPDLENNKIDAPAHFPELLIPDIKTIKKTNSLVSKQGSTNTSSRLSATIFYSPEIVSSSLEDDHPRFREDNRHEIEKNEKRKLASTIGVLVDFNAGKNWILESGITLWTSKIVIEPKIIYARTDNFGNLNYRFNCSAGYSFVDLNGARIPTQGDSIRTIHATNTLQYIGIPLAVKYVINEGKFRLVPGIGLAANFLIKGQIETTLPTSNGIKSASTNDIHGLKSSYFQAFTSFGLEYKLSNSLALALKPTARFALSSINKDAPVKTKLNSYGVGAGLVVKF